MDHSLEDPNAHKRQQVLEAERQYIAFHGRAPPPNFQTEALGQGHGQSEPPMNHYSMGPPPTSMYGLDSSLGSKRGRGVEDDDRGDSKRMGYAPGRDRKSVV